MECSLAAHLRYDELIQTKQNAAASFGTIIHHCFQQYNDSCFNGEGQGNLEGAVNRFIDLWFNPEKLGVVPEYWPKGTDWGSYRRLGVELLTQFHESQAWQKRTVIGTEIPFVVPFGRHELMGFVDLVDIKRNGRGRDVLRIIDLKSNGKTPNRAMLGLDAQFTTYMWAVSQVEFWIGNGTPEFPGLPDGAELWDQCKDLQRQGVWFHLRTCKEIGVGPRVGQDFERLYRVVEAIDRATKLEVFVPHIGDACFFCDYKEQCPLEIPDALEQQEEDDLAAYP